MNEEVQRTFDSDFCSSSDSRELGFESGKGCLIVRARLKAPPRCPEVLDAKVYLLGASVNDEDLPSEEEHSPRLHPFPLFHAGKHLYHNRFC